MERIEFEHRGCYNPQAPVLIYQKESIGHLKKEIIGIIKIGDNILKEGDILKSSYIGNNATASLPYKSWEVKEIKERFTPAGHFIVDVENAGFVATVEPYTE